MTLKEFQALEITEQAIAVWTGTFPDTIVEAKYNVHLYNVSNLYVQIYYSNKVNNIVKIRAFKSTSLYSLT